jgi:arylsulfatase A-like enzyme
LACISQVDDVFGQLLDFLDERGLAKNTIVVYGADHGAYHGIHGICEKAPGISSEAVCRVPMIWRVPGITHGGTVNSRFIENIDIAPTLTALCGLTPMDSVDGLDASSLLASDNAELHPVAVTENAYTKALRWGRWRFVHHQPDVNPDGEDVGELYDLDEDPDETRNLYHNAEHQDTVHACRRLLLEWLIRTTRVTTTHPAVTIGGDDGACRRGDSTSLSYPLAGDGTAPNTVQPRFRQDLAENYI